MHHLFAVRYDSVMVNHHIRKWRKHRGLTLNELADRMEIEPGVRLISDVSLGRIERGIQPYSQPVLEALAEALQVTTAQLLSDDPLKDGDVIDITRMLASASDDDRKRLLAIVKAAVGA
ncbi:MAG: helix-turn-helix transcriptional regulator [Pseudomonadota bacterium]